MRSPSPKRVTFRLESPAASEVYVAGAFNGWSPNARKLRKGKDGVWSTWTTLPPGRYEYLFVVDGAWIPDPQCAERTPNEFGAENSVLYV